MVLKLPRNFIFKTGKPMTKPNEILNFDHLVIGSGLAGLFTALQLSKLGTVAVVTKRSIDESNTKYAQGGIACVMDNKQDSFEEHVKDTMTAGDHLCKEDVVRKIVENGPAAVKEIIELGTKFTTRREMGYQEDGANYDLGREGGHTRRRVLHAGDITGEEVEKKLIRACQQTKNITFF